MRLEIGDCAKWKICFIWIWMQRFWAGAQTQQHTKRIGDLYSFVVLCMLWLRLARVWSTFRVHNLNMPINFTRARNLRPCTFWLRARRVFLLSFLVIISFFACALSLSTSCWLRFAPVIVCVCVLNACLNIANESLAIECYKYIYIGRPPNDRYSLSMDNIRLDLSVLYC